jgi:hypothetical protein
LDKPNEVLSEIIADLRRKRLEGATISQLVAEFHQQGLDLDQINRHFREGFGPSRHMNLTMMPKDESGNLIPDLLDDFIGSRVDASRDEWSDAPAYPDLMRRRDRHTFRQLARLTGNIFIVCAADRVAGQYIGKPGYRPAPYPMLGVPRSSPPNQGLLAADPNALTFRKLLESTTPATDYEQYQQHLERLAFKVGNQRDGYIIRDQNGSAFYAGYQLHGVYKEDGGSNAWTGSEGEKLRAELNRRMGEDLIQTGPLDRWAERLDLAETNPFCGPRPPVLFFLPNGNVQVRSDAKSMELYYRFLGIRWEDLYPSELPRDEEEQEETEEAEESE